MSKSTHSTKSVSAWREAEGAASIASALDYYWRDCEADLGRHDAVGGRDLLAAAHVLRATEEGASAEETLLFLRKSAEAAKERSRDAAELARVTRILDMVLADADSVPDELVCEVLLDMLDARPSSLRARRLTHVAKAAIFLRAKQADPDSAISIERAVVDATVDTVQDIAELSGLYAADRFLSDVRRHVGALFVRRCAA